MKICRILFLTVTLILAVSGGSFAKSSRDEIFQLGNESYKQGKYNDAIKFYETLVKKGVKNGYLFYNLGNAYFKNKQIGKAILNYERAKLYLPNDKDIKYNLKYANTIKVDRISEPEYNPFTKVILFIYNVFGVNTLAIIVEVLLWIIVAIFIIKWLVKDYRIKDLALKIFPYAAITFIVLLLIFVIKVYNIENSEYGIVTVNEGEVKSGPGNDYTVIFTLHEGTKVKKQNVSGNWYQVTLPNGYTGWLKKGDIEMIEP